ncbi:MAG: peroxiredoxin [Armatimonadota bacterium]
MDQCEQPHMLLLGDTAPIWEAVTTHGKKSLTDYKGKWVVMFSHPADFTPVCTTEFMAFANHNTEFMKRNVQLIGLSIDSIHSHIAWIRNIKEKFGVDIPFPIIADLDMKVAKMYGMLHSTSSATATVRSVFVIDDNGILRAMLYYPMTNGRNVEEILRIIDACQTSDKYKVATPESWKPGDKVIVPPPATAEAAEKRVNEGYECVDWYFCKKSID